VAGEDTAATDAGTTEHIGLNEFDDGDDDDDDDDDDHIPNTVSPE